MNCRIRKSAGTWRTNTALLTASVLGISLVGGSSLAVDFTQEPSAFDITTDGIFTDGAEWSDVTPAVRLSGQSFVYTSADPGLGALYLMYDLPSSVVPLTAGLKAGPVHFHNSGASFDVFFNIGFDPELEILKDGAPFDPSGPVGGEPSIEGASGFGSSPNSTAPHNMFELEVLFDGSDVSLMGHNHGQYSPDPSHWGAGLPTDPSQTEEPQCVLADDPDCDPDNDPSGGGEPIPVECPVECPDAGDPTNECPDPTNPANFNFGQNEFIQVLFGEDVSNACVNVVFGSGGDTEITAIPLPGEDLVIETDVKPGSNPNCVNPRSGGVISVAYLGSADLDAADIAPATLRWGGASPVRCNFEDVDGDGITDLVCKYKKSDVDLPAPPDDCVIVEGSGAFLDGTPFVASDHVCVAGGPACNASTPQ